MYKIRQNGDFNYNILHKELCAVYIDEKAEVTNENIATPLCFLKAPFNFYIWNREDVKQLEDTSTFDAIILDPAEIETYEDLNKATGGLWELIINKIKGLNIRFFTSRYKTVLHEGEVDKIIKYFNYASHDVSLV